ncbi:MAG: hypothetical protein ACYC5W_04350 [Thauera sp.]|jgi:hypothetical protein
MNEDIQATPKAKDEPVAAAPAPAQAAASPMKEAAVQAAPKRAKKPAPETKAPKAPAVAASAVAEAEKPVATPKAPAKPVKKAVTVEAPAPAEPAKPAKAKKHAPAKPKLVRDSFTLPEDDYVLFTTLKKRALAGGAEVKKSELLRAALAMLARADDAEFLKAIGLVERIKTGRPKK